MKIPEITQTALKMTLDKVNIEGVEAILSQISKECPWVFNVAIEPFAKKDPSGLTKKVAVTTYWAIRSQLQMHPNYLLYAELDLEIDKSPLPEITKEMANSFLLELLVNNSNQQLKNEIMNDQSILWDELALWIGLAAPDAREASAETLFFVYWFITFALRNVMDLSTFPH